jgi:phosphonate metabolism-associated iron-containing alcohol dehydrogenase
LEADVWTYRNPVDIQFGRGLFDRLDTVIAGRRYALVTYPDPLFAGLSERLAGRAGAPTLTIADVAPNPDFELLASQAARFDPADLPEVIVALGGGSVIDSAKVFAAAGGDFAKVRRYLETSQGGDTLSRTPIVAAPTTAGTGSEVTCWGTVWDRGTGWKFSINRPSLYPTHAVIDPDLMVAMPRGLTVVTGLDALSHSFESIWNRSANPVSTNHAVAAAREILEVLPRVANELGDVGLRERMAKAALFAGLAFSNTKTAIAHSISYPITLRHGVQHGIACSFSLPLIVRSLAAGEHPCRSGLQAILGDDLLAGADRLEAFLNGLGVSTDPASYGVAAAEWRELIDQALGGERGQNFIGSREMLLAVDPFADGSLRRVPAQ